MINPQYVIQYLQNPPDETINDDGSVTQVFTSQMAGNDTIVRTHIASAEEYQELQLALQALSDSIAPVITAVTATLQTSTNNLAGKKTINPAIKA